MTKSILFQLDSVIINSKRFLYSVVNQIAEATEQPAYSFAIYNRIQTSHEFDYFSQKLHATAEKNFYTLLREYHTDDVIHQNLEATLRLLRKQGYKLYVIAPRSRTYLHSFLPKEWWSKFFEDTYTYECGGIHNFAVLCESLGINRFSSYFVGNDATLLNMAQMAHLRTIYAVWYDEAPSDIRSHFHFYDPSQLLSLNSNEFVTLHCVDEQLKKIQRLAQDGLLCSKDIYDLERFHAICESAKNIYRTKEYTTPKPRILQHEKGVR